MAEKVQEFELNCAEITDSNRASEQNELQVNHSTPNATLARPWTTGPSSWKPWLAIWTLVSAILCTFASMAILIISDGQPTRDWDVKPAVILSILSTAANTAIGFLITEGITISWWRRALHGATISSLHRIWSYGYSLQSAIFSGWRFEKVALATLCAMLILLDGPLLQRASSIEAKDFSLPVTLNLSLPQQIPPGFSGSEDPTQTTVDANPAFMLVLQKNQLEPTAINSSYVLGSGCSGTCNGTIRAAGVLPHCVKQTYTYDFSNGTEADPGVPFSISYRIDSKPSLNISINSTKMGAACIGKVVSQLCSLQAATIDYPISITNSTVTLLPIIDRKPAIYDGGDSSLELGAPSGSLHGVGIMLEAFYLSNATIYKDNTGDAAVPYITYENGVQALEYMDLSLLDPSVAKNESFNTNQPILCQFSSWHDPTLDILNTIDLLMLRTVLAVAERKAQDINITLTAAFDIPLDTVSYVSSFAASQTETLLAFKTDYGYLAVVTVLMLVCILGVAQTMWGWWELGRPVSLSPLETAKAFGSATLDVFGAAGSNATAETLAKELGNVRVRYGALQGQIQDEKGEVQPILRVAAEGKIVPPEQGQMFD